MKQASEGPLWTPLRSRLSPTTLTVMLTLRPSMLRLTASTMTTVCSSFPAMTMSWLQNLAGGPYSPLASRSKSPLDHQHQWEQEEERGPHPLGSPCSNSSPNPMRISQPLYIVSSSEPLKEERDLGSPSLSCTINKAYRTQPKKKRNKLTNDSNFCHHGN